MNYDSPPPTHTRACSHWEAGGTCTCALAARLTEHYREVVDAAYARGYADATKSIAAVHVRSHG